jgi:hypothetical protein
MTANQPRQTRPEPYPDDVVRFGDALEAVMSDRTYDLDGIVAGLNARGVTAGGRTAWTAESLRAYLVELAEG